MTDSEDTGGSLPTEGQIDPANTTGYFWKVMDEFGDDTPIKELTPEEYLDFAADEKRHGDWATQYRLVVTGPVDLVASPLKSRIRRLPAAKILGSLQATDCQKLEDVSCRVGGDAFLGGTGITYLGASFGCDGNLMARNCRRLTGVQGSFPKMVDLGDSSVERLGEDFSCGANLHVDGCDRLVELDCSVAGSVGADESGISKFGRNFFCGGNLDLTKCPNIKKLGAMPSARLDDVCLDGSGIVQIDPGFRCNRDLVIREAEHLVSISGNVGGALHVTRAPKLERVEQMSVGGRGCFEICPRLSHLDLTIRGGLHLQRCGITSLEPRTVVGGELSLCACPNFSEMRGGAAWDVHLVDLPSLQEIRTDFGCGGNLTIMKCPLLTRLGGRVGGETQLADLRGLGSLSRGFTTGGNLTLGGLPKLKSLGCEVGGNLKVLVLPKLEETRVEFCVQGSLEFEECPNIKTLRGRVEGDTKMRRVTGVEKIGADFECGGNLLLEECTSMRILNCEVGGDVSLRRCGVTKLGPAFGCGGKVSVEDEGWRIGRGIGKGSTPHRPPRLREGNQETRSR